MIPSSPSSRLLTIRTEDSNQVELDVDNQCLWIHEQAVPLTPKAFQALHYLSLHEQELVSQEDLRKHLWPDTFVDPGNVKKYVLEIRNALDDDPRQPKFIETLPRRGYRFLPSVHTVAPFASSDSVPAVRFPIAGRDSHLSTLQQLFSKVEAGEFQMAFVTGAPGIGKTALIKEFLRWLNSRGHVRCRFAECSEEDVEREPYYPVLNILEDLCETDATGSTARTVGEYTPSLIPRLSEYIFRAQPHLLERSVHRRNSRRTMSREIIRALTMIARTEPVVLVVEDIQWADSATIAFFNTLARRNPSARLMVIATSRPPLPNTDDSPLYRIKDDLCSRSLCAAIPLESLSQHDIATWLTQLVPNSRPNLQLTEMLYEHSGGNPFLMHAILDDLTAHGFCRCERGEWRTTIAPKAIRVPDRVRKFVTLQLHSLTENDIELLEAASVAGYTFSTGVIAAALDTDIDSAEASIMRFVGSGYFLRNENRSPITQENTTGEWAFLLALVREIIYERLPPGRRRRMHHRIANWLESCCTGRDTDMDRLLATHFREAGEWARSMPYLLLSAEPADRETVLEEVRRSLSGKQDSTRPFAVARQQRRTDTKMPPTGHSIAT